MDVPGGDRAVLLDAHSRVGDLVAALVGDRHVLAPRLDPLDRALELARAPGREDLLAVDLQLRAEAAPDLGRDHAHALLAHPEQDREEQAHEVRYLGRAPERQRAGPIVGQHSARLDWRARRAVVDEPPLDDHVCLGEACLEVASRQRPLVHLVGPELLVHVRRAGEGRLWVDHDRQRLVLDQNLLGRVDDRVAVLAEHDGDRIPHVLDGLPRERPVLGVVDLHARRHPRQWQRPARSARSAPVKTAWTPGHSRAAAVSIDVIRAFASGERTSDAHSIPGSEMSSM